MTVSFWKNNFLVTYNSRLSCGKSLKTQLKIQDKNIINGYQKHTCPPPPKKPEEFPEAKGTEETKNRDINKLFLLLRICCLDSLRV